VFSRKTSQKEQQTWRVNGDEVFTLQSSEGLSTSTGQRFLSQKMAVILQNHGDWILNLSYIVLVFSWFWYIDGHRLLAYEVEKARKGHSWYQTMVRIVRQHVTVKPMLTRIWSMSMNSTVPARLPCAQSADRECQYTETDTKCWNEKFCLK
jgi:hypothetical protein